MTNRFSMSCGHSQFPRELKQGSQSLEGKGFSFSVEKDKRKEKKKQADNGALECPAEEEKWPPTADFFQSLELHWTRFGLRIEREIGF